MSQGSYYGGMHARRTTMSPDQQQEIGPLIGLPINPCPRCGDRVLELRSRKDGEVFFKCDGNDQDIPYDYRRCGFYKSAKQYADLVATHGLLGINITRYGIEEKSKNKGQPLQDRMFPMKEENYEDDGKMDREGNYKYDVKMDKLIGLSEKILVTNVLIAVVVTIGVILMLFK